MMNNKQKTLITIYVIVSLLVVIGVAYVTLSVVFNPNTPPIDLSGNPLPRSMYDSYGELFGAIAVSSIIGIVLLGIPTFILYKVWKDKK